MAKKNEECLVLFLLHKCADCDDLVGFSEERRRSTDTTDRQAESEVANDAAATISCTEQRREQAAMSQPKMAAPQSICRQLKQKRGLLPKRRKYRELLRAEHDCPMQKSWWRIWFCSKFGNERRSIPSIYNEIHPSLGITTFQIISDSSI